MAIHDEIKDEKLNYDINREAATISALILFRMDPFGDAHRCRGNQKALLSPPAICHTYPTMMKLGTVVPYLNESQKHISARQTPWVVLTAAFFHRMSGNYVISKNTDIDCIYGTKFLILLIGFESLKILQIK